MSRPKAWNGSQWVDPAFWTGSEWKSYVPARYDVPLQRTFDASAEGCHGNWDPAGFIWRDNGAGGLLSGANVGMSWYDAPSVDIEGAAGHMVKAQASWSWEYTGGSSQAYPNEWDFDVSLAGWGTGSAKVEATHNLEISTGWLVAETPAAVIHPAGSGGGYGGVPRLRGWSFDINQNTADFSSPYIQGRIRCDWFRFWDLTTGQVLMGLGAPGWEPKVKRADGTWQ